MKVQKVADSTWTVIDQILEKIEFMGWPTSPQSMTVENTTDSITLNPDEYFYIEETKRLTVLYEFDMNEDYTVNFE